MPPSSLLKAANLKALLTRALTLNLPLYPDSPTPSGLSLSEIASAAATAVPESPVSNVPGLAFDRFYHLWMENTVSNPFQALPARFLIQFVGF